MTARTLMALLALACAGCSESARVEQLEMEVAWVEQRVQWLEARRLQSDTTLWYPLGLPDHRDTTGGRR